MPVVILTAGSFFYSVSVLPLAEALTLSFLAPVFVALLGALILKERLDGRILQALGFGLAGMLVMVWPRLQGGVTGAELGVAAALFSAVSYAFNLILLRRIAVKEHPAIIVLFQNAGPALCGTAGLFRLHANERRRSARLSRRRCARRRRASFADLGFRACASFAAGTDRVHGAGLGEPARLVRLR